VAGAPQTTRKKKPATPVGMTEYEKRKTEDKRVGGVRATCDQWPVKNEELTLSSLRAQSALRRETQEPTCRFGTWGTQGRRGN